MSIIPSTKSNKLLTSNISHTHLNNPEKREKQAYIKKGEMIFQKRKTLLSDLNFIFNLVIKIFNYEKFYKKESKDFELIFNGKLNSIINNLNNSSNNNYNNNSTKENFNCNNYLNNKSPAKMLLSKEEIFTKKFAYAEIQKLFNENKIFFDKENYNLLTKSKSSEFLLNQVKLWIAFIIVLKDKKMNTDTPCSYNSNNNTSNINSNKLYENINFVNKIFENALKRKIDKVFLFEFFIIFLAEQKTLALLNANFLENKPENYLDNNLNDFENKNEVFVPKDFIEIYSKYRAVLKNLIKADDESEFEENKEQIFKNDQKKIDCNNNFDNSVVSTKNSSMNLVSTKKIIISDENKFINNYNYHHNNKSNLNKIINNKYLSSNSVISSSSSKNIKTKILEENKNEGNNYNNNQTKHSKKLTFAESNFTNIENDFKEIFNSNINNNNNILNINESFSNTSFHDKNEKLKHNHFLENNLIDEKFNLESVKSEKNNNKYLETSIKTNAIKNQNLLILNNNLNSKEQQKNLLTLNNNLINNNNNNLNNSDSLNFNFNNFNNLMNNSDFVQINKEEFSFFTKDKTEDSQFFLKCDKLIISQNLDSEILNTNIKNLLEQKEEEENSSIENQSSQADKICNISKLNVSAFNNLDVNSNFITNNDIHSNKMISNKNDSYNEKNICNYNNESANSKLNSNKNFNRHKNDKEIKDDFLGSREVNFVKDLDKKSEEKLQKIQINVNELIEDEELLNSNFIENNQAYQNVFANKDDFFANNNDHSKSKKSKGKTRNEFVKTLSFDFNQQSEYKKNNFFFDSEKDNQLKSKCFIIKEKDQCINNKCEYEFEGKFAEEKNANNDFIFKSPDKKPRKLTLYKEAEETILIEEIKSYKNPFAIKPNKTHQESNKIVDNKNDSLLRSSKNKSGFYSDSKRFLNKFNKKINLYLNHESKNSYSNLNILKSASVSISEPNNKNSLLSLAEAEKKANSKINKEFQIKEQNKNSIHKDPNASCNINHGNNSNKSFDSFYTEKANKKTFSVKEIKAENAKAKFIEECKKSDLLCEKKNKHDFLFESKEKSLFLLESIKIESPLNLLDLNNCHDSEKINRNQISLFTEEAFKDLRSCDIPNPKSPTLSNYLIPTNKSNSDLSNCEENFQFDTKSKFQENTNYNNSKQNDKKNKNKNKIKNKKLNNSDDHSEKKHSVKKNSIRENYEFGLQPVKNFAEFYYEKEKEEEMQSLKNESLLASAFKNKNNSFNTSDNKSINFSFYYKNSNKPLMNFSNFLDKEKEDNYSDDSLLTPEKLVIKNKPLKQYEDYRGSIKTRKAIVQGYPGETIKRKNEIRKLVEQKEVCFTDAAACNLSLEKSIEFSIGNNSNLNSKKRMDKKKEKINSNSFSLEIKAADKNTEEDSIIKTITEKQKQKYNENISIKTDNNNNSNNLRISTNQIAYAINKNHKDENSFADPIKPKNTNLNISSAFLEIKSIKDNLKIEENLEQELEQTQDLDYKLYLMPENFDIVESNYLKNNYFCVLELKSILKIILNCEFAILPLKEKYENFTEKLNMLSDLYMLRNSDYSDFGFLPYNQSIIDILDSV